jgi:hypothetical protein
MKTSFFGVPIATKNIITTGGYGLVSEAQLTVGVAPIVIATPPVNATYTFLLINRSAAAQNIRAGFAPSFAPASGILLLPNDVIIFENVTFAVSVVASAAGALLDTLVLFQSA